MSGLVLCDCCPPDETKRMTRAEREAWILGYLGKRQEHAGTNYRFKVDVLTSHFVEAYIRATGVTRFRVQLLGAPSCPILGEDLSRMARETPPRLVRARVGISDMPWGFPKWVWAYSLA